MSQEVKKINQIIDEIEHLISIHSIEEFETKPSNLAWSKKEIIGHLIDSALNNIQRFTEIQYSEKPYRIRKYNQDALVIANNYQNKNVLDLFQLWFQLNKQLGFIIQNQNQTTLEYELILPDGQLKNLEFLIIDYISHLEHHLNQIKS